MPRPHRNLLEGGLCHVDNRFSSGEEIFANPEETARCVELVRVAKRRDGFWTTRLRELVAAVGIERWGQRAGELDQLPGKHPDAVSRWARVAGVRRTEHPALAEQHQALDRALGAVPSVDEAKPR